MNKTRHILTLQFILTFLWTLAAQAQEVPFLIGEKVFYDVEFGRIKVGSVSSEVVEVIKIDGQDVYHILTRSKSTAWVSRIYRVNNLIHTYIDVQTLLPVKIERYIEEGFTKTHMVIDIDQKRRMAYFYEDDKEDKVINTKSVVYDTLAAMYKLRQIPIRPNTDLYMQIIGGYRVGRLKARMEPKRSEEVIFLGRKKVLDVYPIKQIGGWEVEVLLSADRARIPVKVVAFNVKLLKLEILSLTGWIKEYDKGDANSGHSSNR